MRHALFTRNESNYISPAIWNQLSQTSKQDILRAKLNLPRRTGGGYQGNTGAQADVATETPKAAAVPITYGKPMAKQYGTTEDKKANMAAHDEEQETSQSDEEEGSSGDEDPETESDFKLLKKAFLAQRQVNMTRTETEETFEAQLPVINANLNYIDRMANLFTKKDEHLYHAVTDNGADTTVMGDGWLILGDLEHAPRANLVGLDKDAKKKGLPIIAGAIKVETEDGDPVILKVHQGVYNAGSKITLISEFQVRDHGLIIDSISTKHMINLDGNTGTQSFWVSPEQRLPLRLKGGLMTFTYTKPSWEDMEKLDVIEITNEMPWHPVLHSDDPLAIRTMNENSAFNIKMDPPAPLFEDLWHIDQGGTHDSEGDTFYDTTSTTFPVAGYSSDTFLCSRNQDNEQAMFYFDPADISTKGQYGRAFHLTLNFDSFLTKREEPTVFVRESTVDALLTRIDNAELTGQNESFDSYVYAIRAVHRFKEEELELIQPYLGFRPLEVVRQTLLHTTQLAKAIVHAPLKKHFHSRFRYLNRLRIHETVSMDTLFANCKGVTGKSCAQVFYGLTSHMMNVYGMKSKK
jgi:hypothetical protein